MNVIAVDDESSNLSMLQLEMEGIRGIRMAGMFRNGGEALDYVQKTSVDAVVLDVELPDMDGITLGARLKKCCPDIQLIYLTAQKDYAYDAFQLEASAYLLKPFDRVNLRRALEKARKIPGGGYNESRGEYRIYIRTFGKFEMFVDGRVVEFSCKKAKELLALLVDRRGGIVTTEEMLTYLWEDRPNNDRSRNYCRKVVQRLHKELEKCGIEEILLSHKRGKSLDVSRVECDYYQYLEGSILSKTEFRGEYMTNYSWAEETLAGLIHQ